MTTSSRYAFGLLAATCLLGTLVYGGGAAAASDLRVVEAARSGDFAAVNAVLRRGNVNAREVDGSTALLWAVYHVDLDAVNRLIAAGADVNAADRYGVTPLLQACRVGNAAILQAILKAGANVRARYPFGETPLMDCAYSGSLDAVKQLIARGEAVNAIEETQQETALMMAAEQGHLDVVRALLGAGANPNLAAKRSSLKLPEVVGGAVKVDYPRGGMTALMFAAREGHADVVQELLAAGADPNVKNPDGMTAMLLAIVNDRIDLASLLLDHGANPNGGALTALIDLYNAHVYSAAHSATRTRPWHHNETAPLQLLTKLLDHGASPTLPAGYTLNAYGPNWTVETVDPAYVAALMGQDADVLRVFFDRHLVAANQIPAYTPAPAVPGAMGPIGAPSADATPLLTAARGAGVRRGLPGSPFGPYEFAGDRGASQAAAVLLQFGADVNAGDKHGDRPIHIAAENGDLAAIKLLAAHGAALGVKNAAGLTPVDLAMGKRPPVPADERRGFILPPPKPHEQAAVLIKTLMGAGGVPKPQTVRTQDSSGHGAAKVSVADHRPGGDDSVVASVRTDP